MGQTFHLPFVFRNLPLANPGAIRYSPFAVLSDRSDDALPVLLFLVAPAALLGPPGLARAADSPMFSFGTESMFYVELLYGSKRIPMIEIQGTTAPRRSTCGAQARMRRQPSARLPSPSSPEPAGAA